MARSQRRFWSIAAVFAACILAGALGTWFLVRNYGWWSEADTVATLARWLILAPLLLAVHLALRFVRWRLLHRGVGLNLPERFSARVYLTSFAFNFTPFYLGPTLYRAMALSSLSSEAAFRRKAIGISVAEVFCDAAGIAVIGLIGAIAGPADWLAAWPLWVVAAFSLVPSARSSVMRAYCVVVNAAGRLVLKRRTQLPPRQFAHILSTARFIPALALSIAAWSLPPILFVALDHSAGGGASLGAASQSIAEATLAGSLSASPGGAGITGTMLFRRLADLGAAPLPATIFLYRLGTYWLALAAGAAMGLAGGFRRRAAAAQSHFEEIAAIYDAELPEALRQRLVERKAGFMLRHLPGGGLRGLDLGCGQGHYAHRMSDAGYDMTGADASVEQAAAARYRIAHALAADAVHLPFPNACFDFAYAINVLHHLPGRESQRRAVAEIRRILKPGGIFFLHEINTINPVFRFYMGYVFPVLRAIDTGEECWIRPDRRETLGDWRPESVYYYTFLPDFAPEWVARGLRGLERRLEASRFGYLSAHYTAVFVNRSRRS